MPSATALRLVEDGQATSKRPPPRRGPAPVGSIPSSWRYLPHVLVVTFATVIVPLVVVELAQELTGRRSILLSVATAMMLSAASAGVGAALWQRRSRSRDILFGDLMIWGFIRRVSAERRLAEATKLLDDDMFPGEVGEASREDKIEMLEVLARALDARHPFMLGHSQRVARSALMIASRMGLPAEQLAKIRVAAALHDVGKINISSAILNKPGALTDAEFEKIKRHPGDGAWMLAPLGDPEIAAMVRHHHERLDGSGYPDGLSGSGIPLGARIIAVADTFDATTSARPYRGLRKQRDALRILKEEAGTRLDAQAVALFLSCYAGRRTAAWSSLAVAVPERLGALVTGSAGPLGQGAAATVTAVGLGGALINPFLHSDPPTAKVPSAMQHALVKPRPDHGAATPPGASTPKPEKKARPKVGAGKDPASGGSDGTTDAAPPPTAPPGGPRPGSGGEPPTGGSADPGSDGSAGALPAIVDSILGSGGGGPPSPPALPELPALPIVPGPPKL